MDKQGILVLQKMFESDVNSYANWIVHFHFSHVCQSLDCCSLGYIDEFYRLTIRGDHGF